MAHDKNPLSLYKDLKTSITSFYSAHSHLHTNGTIDMQEILEKMTKVDLFLEEDFKALWEMERFERSMPSQLDEISTIQQEETVILNPEAWPDLVARRAEAKREAAEIEELRTAIDHTKIHAEGVREGVYTEQLRTAIEGADPLTDLSTLPIGGALVADWLQNTSSLGNAQPQPAPRRDVARVQYVRGLTGLVGGKIQHPESMHMGKPPPSLIAPCW